MLQMLPKVVRSEELLCVIALSKFVHFLQMNYSYLPILFGGDGNLMTRGRRRGDSRA
jgi:hypothetical protein